MQIDLDYLRRHYASLSDEGLREIDETELVDEARRIYDAEVAARGPTAGETENIVDRPDDDDEELDGEPEPDWLKDAACPASFASLPGVDAAQQAAAARTALRAARIPVYVSSGEVEPEPDSPTQYEFRVMVPGKWLLEAESVLDQEIFNREVEGQWKTHFQMLSDEELRALDPQVLFGGLRDKIERVTRAYEEELRQRR